MFSIAENEYEKIFCFSILHLSLQYKKFGMKYSPIFALDLPTSVFNIFCTCLATATLELSRCNKMTRTNWIRRLSQRKINLN